MTDTSWQTTNVNDGTEMRLYIARPNAKKAPAVIVLQEAFGVNHHIRVMAERFVTLGYVAVAPELFHRTAPGFEGDYNDFASVKPHLDAVNNGTLEADLKASFDWLKSDPQADESKTAAIGYCMGGKAAFIGNTVVPLKAAISYYGTGIQGCFQDYAAKQQAPLTLIWGGKDDHISPEKRAEILKAVMSAGKAVTEAIFSDAGHGFSCDERSAYNANATKEAWGLVTAILENRFA